MRLDVALLLALPRGAADRRRAFLLAGAVALAGVLLIAAIRLGGIRGGAYDPELSNYLTEPGLRSGVVTGALLLCVPVAALLLQALRVGALARGRRTAGLRLAGGSPAAVRTVAAVEGGISGLVGGLLAGPVYLALGASLRAAPARELAVVPPPTTVDLAVWLAVTVLTTAGAAVSGLLVERRAVVDPLSTTRHRRPTGPGRPSLLVLAAGVVLLVLAFALPATPALVLAGAGGLAVAFAGGPWFVRGLGSVLLRAEGPLGLVVGSRLAADLRPAGRVAAVLVLCGIAIGIDLVVARDVAAQSDASNDAFYAAGVALAAGATVVAASIAVVALVVGAVEGLIDGRRPLAGLAALGAGESFLARALHLQLAVVAAPPVFIGIAAAGLLPSLLAPGTITGTGADDVLLVFGVAALGAVWMVVVAGLVTLGLRRRIRATVDPHNLRAA